MKRLLIQCLHTLFAILMISCSEDSSLEKMEAIKRVGNEDPQLALAMLDSLEIEVRDRSEYIRSKYDLLRIRLNDKAVILHTSDIKIKKLVEFFEKKGAVEEKQEVYYYAGSVYRDLQDTPRALENFFRSAECSTIGDACDSVMLRNTYSNICFLQYRVQNFSEALAIAKEEAKISTALGIKDVISYMHIGAAYKAIDSIEQSINAYDKALNIIVDSKNKSSYQESIIRLFMDYSAMNNIDKARVCISYINDSQSDYLATLRDMAFASYYESCEKEDSAIYYLKRIAEGKADTNNKYDASKKLFRIYTKSGDVAKANQYARAYMQLSDSLDFGKRQELAATVNNAYKYHLDEKKEQKLKEEKERYRYILIVVILATITIFAVLCMLNVRRRNIHLRKVVELSSEIKRLADIDKQLCEEIENKEKELHSSRESLAKTNNELVLVKQEYERVNSEIKDYNEALKEKERQLSERMEQNKTFIKLLHQSELEGKAEDVIFAIRQSSAGRKNMTSADWKQLYQAVDDLYPDFKDKLLKELGTFTEQQMQVCYLIRIGLANTQIQNMTNLSRVTVWRWIKKYGWISRTPD